MEWTRRKCRNLSFNSVLVILLFVLNHLPLTSTNNVESPLSLSGYIEDQIIPVQVDRKVRVKRAAVENVPFSETSSISLPPPVPSNDQQSVIDVDETGDLIVLRDVLSCDRVTNAMVRQFKDLLYMLSGNQLFRLEITTSGQSLYPIATFEVFSENATDFTIQRFMKKTLVVAISFHTHYIVHRLPVPKGDDREFKSFNVKRHAVQKIPIQPADQRSIKVQLFTSNDNGLYLLRAETNDQNSSSIIS